MSQKNHAKFSSWVKIVNGQNYITLQGKITNKNNTPFEYASIGLIGTTIGTVSCIY